MFLVAWYKFPYQWGTKYNVTHSCSTCGCCNLFSEHVLIMKVKISFSTEHQTFQIKKLYKSSHVIKFIILIWIWELTQKEADWIYFKVLLLILNLTNFNNPISPSGNDPFSRILMKEVRRCPHYMIHICEYALANPEICLRCGPMTSKNCGPMWWPSSFNQF